MDRARFRKNSGDHCPKPCPFPATLEFYIFKTKHVPIKDPLTHWRLFRTKFPVALLVKLNMMSRTSWRCRISQDASHSPIAALFLLESAVWKEKCRHSFKNKRVIVISRFCLSCYFLFISESDLYFNFHFQCPPTSYHFSKANAGKEALPLQHSLYHSGKKWEQNCI